MIVKELQYFLRYLQRGLLKTPEFVKLVQGMISTLEGPEKLIREIYMFRLSAECCGFESHPKAASFSFGKVIALGVLCCFALLVV